MCNLFLLQDLGVFELQIEEPASDVLLGETIARVLDRLPPASDAVVDVRAVRELDIRTARELAAAARRRAEDGVAIVFVCSGGAHRSLLAAAGVDPLTSIATCPRSARSLLANSSHRLPAAS